MQNTRRVGRSACLALGVSVGLLACESETDGPAAQAGIVPGVAPATSINAVMVGLVDHAAHHIWDVGREGMGPQDESDWEEVVHHSIQLIAAGTVITTGGTGIYDSEWVSQADWQGYARGVSEAGSAALAAANRQDLDGVLQAGDQLVEMCEGCHAQYKPALPTEGIVHPHR
jgi:hypothetical protein